ncbi:MAG: methylmalonyl-CoA mutase family protein [Actinomycetota bacterium]|nr:methylmalonyl-CoA mutase family protein [Actinomycetota bacterium]
MSASDVAPLAARFAEPSRDEWLDAATKALRGRPLESLVTRTPEGLEIQPLYGPDDHPTDGDPAGLPGLLPFTRGTRAAGGPAGGWDVSQSHDSADHAAANEAILTDLEKGVTSIRLNARGTHTVDDLDRVLDGVMLDLAGVWLEPSTNPLGPAALLMALWERRGVAPSAASGGFGADPLGVLARRGTLPQPLDEALADAADLAALSAARYPGVRALSVDAAIVADAGGSDADELAYALACGVAYLRAATSRGGLDVDAACAELIFTLTAGVDQFASIAKLRAARRCWARVAEVAGASADSPPMFLHAVTAPTMFAARDPWVNILRGTIATFAAAVAGADAVTVVPFDAALGLPDPLARRVARNTQLVLADESRLAAVVDPAGGSWYVEARTEELAAEAWRRFQAIEAAGGLAAALGDGSLAATIDASWEPRARALATRKAALTGVSEFPSLEEVLPRRTAEAPPSPPADTSEVPLDLAPAGDGTRARSAVAAVTDGATTGRVAATVSGPAAWVTPLEVRRPSAPFEALRNAAEHASPEPTILLITLGPIATHTARATWAANLFAVGGVRSIEPGPLDDVAAAVAAFEADDSTVVCLCSSDDVYAERAAETATALREAGARRIYLAGKPGEHEQTWRDAGVDEFVHVGIDVLDTLQRAHDHLGVARP